MGLSRAELALKIGATERTIYMWEERTKAAHNPLQNLWREIEKSKIAEDEQ